MTSSSKKKIIILISLIIVIAVGTIFFVLWQKGKFTREDLPDPSWDLSANEAAVGEEWTVEQEISDKLERKIVELCGTEYGLAEWYRLPVRSEQLDGEQAMRLRAEDQLLYGLYLLKQDRLEDFSSWHKVFVENFLNAGRVAEFIEINQTAQPSAADYSWESTLQYVRVLMVYYQAKPQMTVWQEIQDISDLLIKDFAAGIPAANLQMAVPTAAAAPDPAATPTPVPLITPTPEPPPIYGLIRLSSIDLHTISQLTVIDDNWVDIYEKWLKIVAEGLISEQTPMYALAVWPDSLDYLNFAGDSGAVNSRESLATMLNLAQVGQIDQQAMYWVNDQLVNNFAIYESYNIIQGHAINQNENPSVYALTAMIARLAEDKTLYDNSIDRLFWHTATSQRSEALDTVFRQDEEGVVTVRANDNLLTLLAYR